MSSNTDCAQMKLTYKMCDSYDNMANAKSCTVFVDLEKTTKSEIVNKFEYQESITSSNANDVS